MYVLPVQIIKKNFFLIRNIHFLLRRKIVLNCNLLCSLNLLSPKSNCTFINTNLFLYVYIYLSIHGYFFMP